MTFKTDDNEQQIITALMSGQTKIFIDGIEIILKPLKRDTPRNKEKKAMQQAKEIVKLLN